MIVSKCDILTGEKLAFSQSLIKNVRKYIFDYFLDQGEAPVIEQIMREHHLSRRDAFSLLKELETFRLLVLVPGTERILMAHPFSNVSTPFRVKTGGKGYYANCAWDAIAFHTMLDNQDVEIDSYCHHCADPIKIQLQNGGLKNAHPQNPLVFISVPAAKWWQNVIDTCSNNMVFLAGKEHLSDWLAHNPGLTGEALTIAQTHALGIPIYKTKLSLDYSRPSVDQLVAHFDSLGLQGPFWKLK